MIGTKIPSESVGPSYIIASMAHKKLDFAIVGQPKSGTTALAQFLAEHPQVCMSQPKEPGYFATDIHDESDAYHGRARFFPVRTREDYDKRFAHAKEGQLNGEATTWYAFSKSAAKNIYKHNPDAKIIILIRNPVDFMHSLHMQYVNATREDEEDFAKALELEPERKQGRHIPPRVQAPSWLFYTERAKYYQQVKRYFDTFPRDNILVMTNEEFVRDNAAAFGKVATFLGIDTDYSPDFKEVKGSEAPRFRALNSFARSSWLIKSTMRILPPKMYVKISDIVHKVILKKQRRQPMDPKLRKRLEKAFVGEAEKTGDLLGRDLVKEWGLDTTE